MPTSTTTDPTGIASQLEAIVGARHVLAGDAIAPELTTDEGLGSVPKRPLAVVMPGSTDEVAALVAFARRPVLRSSREAAPRGCPAGASRVRTGSSSRSPA